MTDTHYPRVSADLYRKKYPETAIKIKPVQDVLNALTKIQGVVSKIRSKMNKDI